MVLVFLSLYFGLRRAGRPSVDRLPEARPVR